MINKIKYHLQVWSHRIHWWSIKYETVIMTGLFALALLGLCLSFKG